MRFEERTSSRDGHPVLERTYTKERGEPPFTPREILTLLSGTRPMPDKMEIMKYKGVVAIQATSIRLSYQRGLESVKTTDNATGRPGITTEPPDVS